jgi:hypothetical protein
VGANQFVQLKVKGFRIAILSILDWDKLLTTGLISLIRRLRQLQVFMILALQVVTVFLAGTAMTMALAHALEFPGKMRLDQRSYMTVQMIYYPGFTLGGISQPLAAIGALVLTLLMRDCGVAFWWVLSAFVALLTMHATFWFVTQPVNRYWLKNQQLGTAGAKFFALDRANPSSTDTFDSNWRRFRDRWEYSHIARAVCSAIALVALAIAIAI